MCGKKAYLSFSSHSRLNVYGLYEVKVSGDGNCQVFLWFKYHHFVILQFQRFMILLIFTAVPGIVRPNVQVAWISQACKERSREAGRTWDLSMFLFLWSLILFMYDLMRHSVCPAQELPLSIWRLCSNEVQEILQKDVQVNISMFVVADNKDKLHHSRPDIS